MRKDILGGKSGFTLTETMIALSIGVVLFTLTLAYNRSSNDQLALYTEQARLVGLLNRAKAFALEKRAGAVGQNICGFGVHWQPAAGGGNNFILFNDLAVGGVACPDGANGQFDANEIREQIDVNPKVAVRAFPGDVIFQPPYLQTNYAANYNELGLAEVSVQDNALTACIAVGPGGTVYSRVCPVDFNPQ